jgi:hypothetical protein
LNSEYFTNEGGNGIFHAEFFYDFAAQRLALPALGRAAERRPTGKKLRRRKMLGIAPESPVSGARFVSRVFVMRLNCKITLNILTATFILF